MVRRAARCHQLLDLVRACSASPCVRAALPPPAPGAQRCSLPPRSKIEMGHPPSLSVQETRQAASPPAPARARSTAGVLCCSRVYAALLPRAPGERRCCLPLRANDADPVHARTLAPLCSDALPCFPGLGAPIICTKASTHARGHPRVCCAAPLCVPGAQRCPLSLRASDGCCQALPLSLPPHLPLQPSPPSLP